MTKINRIEQIRRWKTKRKAVILAHNYQRPEVQDIADFVGDSLELALCAAQTDAKVILFCGVNFMAETAAILNPEKTVLIPDKNARCPMAAMLPAELMQHYREKYPTAQAVLYINTLAEAKAHSDAVCTSANAAEIVNRMKGPTVLLGPDWNLVQYVKEYTSKRVIPVPTFGYCPVHMLFNHEAILKLKKTHPDAEVLAHPECAPDVCAVADFVGSTSKMYRQALVSKATTFIIATEVGLIHRMQQGRADATYIPAYEEAVCAHMKLHTLEKVYQSLVRMRYEVTVPPRIRALARNAVEAMLATRETLA
jgi:quinolinate synthase